MNEKTRTNLFVLFFCLCLVIYFLIPVFIPGTDLIRRFDIFNSLVLNFIFMILLFLFISLILTSLSSVFGRLFILKKPRKVRIGDIMIAHGLVTPERLHEGLAEQRLKIGEILVQGHRITSEQRDRALTYQKQKKSKFGEILRELGFSTDEDIGWALGKMKRRIGEILRDKRYISDYDLTCALSLGAG